MFVDAAPRRTTATARQHRTLGVPPTDVLEEEGGGSEGAGGGGGFGWDPPPPPRGPLWSPTKAGRKLLRRKSSWLRRGTPIHCVGQAIRRQGGW